MWAARLLEALIVVTIFFEVIVPLVRGTPVFPIFRRRREGKLQVELEHAKQDLVEDDIEDQVKRFREEHALRHPKVEEPVQEKKNQVF